MTIREWVVLGASLVCWGCGNDSAQELEDHRQEWLSERPQDYVIEICGTGFACCCELNAVSAGETVATRMAFRGSPFMDAAPRSDDPVVALFDRVSHELASDRCDLESLAFNAEYGFIRDYYFSCGEEGGGEEVKCFQPNTADLSVCPE